MIERIFLIVMCHMLGDYVLQTDYLAASKGKDWYILIVHCVTYCAPFFLVFGFDWRLLVLLAVHLIVDPLKARWHKINLLTDQLIHYLTAMVYLI